ncbi:MAG TPA: helix-turn-helix domain-containing protein [Thermoplasmata archaeon]|nr:helix-turn-helix domain-containing protein [Thermoplasmata archaeon]
MAHSSDPAAPLRSPGPPAVRLESCPIAATLGTIGRKWTLNILRDIAFSPGASFSLILKNNPGLLQRTLSVRLKQLAADGLVVREAAPSHARRPVYRLSEKGLQLWPVLATLAQFGMQNFADRVFADARPRDLEEVFPAATELMLGRFSTSPPRRSRSGPAVPS